MALPSKELYQENRNYTSSSVFGVTMNEVMQTIELHLKLWAPTSIAGIALGRPHGIIIKKDKKVCGGRGRPYLLYKR